MKRSMFISTLAFMFGLGAGPALADCPDYVKDAGKSTSIPFQIKEFNWWSLKCERKGGTRHYHGLKMGSAKSCAKDRIDGCSFGESSDLFSYRDKLIMKAACNIHDLCYSTYHKGLNDAQAKAACDVQFALNLTKARKRFNGTFVEEAVVGAVAVFGGIGDGQKWGKKHCTNNFE